MDDQNLTNQQKLVFHLMDKGLSNDEVASTLVDVAESAFEQFTTEAMRIFGEEDKKAIEAATSEIMADEEIKKRFTEKTGEDADEYLDRILEEQAASFMEDSQSGVASTATSEATPPTSQ